MQKIVNAVALLSGLVSLSVLGGGAYLYVQKDTLIEGAREKATAAITEAITEALLFAPGESQDVVFADAGDYEFFCGPHQGAGMTGVVHVE